MELACSTGFWEGKCKINMGSTGTNGSAKKEMQEEKEVYGRNGKKAVGSTLEGKPGAGILNGILEGEVRDKTGSKEK